MIPQKTPRWSVALWVCANWTVGAGCASNEVVKGSDAADAGVASFSDAALTPMAAPRPCTSITQCEANQICQHTSSLADSPAFCVTPDGTCAADDIYQGAPRTCYPESRCELGAGGGRCTLQPSAIQAFATQQQIILQGPDGRTPITAQGGLTLLWDPPTRAAGHASTSVAVVMSEPPVRRPESNQLANTAAVRWIWSSADPGVGGVEGRVTFDLGYRGLRNDGTAIGPRWGRGAFLRDENYFWFVFNVEDGQVSASSAVQQFRVGPELEQGRQCTLAIECTRAGEVPESFACLDHRCHRRCASAIDCAAVGGQCGFASTLGQSNTARHSGYCTLTSLPDGGTR